MEEAETPKDPNTMDEEQKKTALQWISSKWKEVKTCEICRTKKWTMQEHLVTPVVYKNGLVLGGTIYPQVILICDNCGNTKYFNAVKMGIINKIDQGSENER